MRKIYVWMGVVSLVVGTAISLKAANKYERYVVNGNQIYLLEDDGTQTQTGAFKFGNDSTKPSLPTIANASSFGLKIPVMNSSTTAMAAGMAVTADMLQATTSVANGAFVALSGTSTVIGIVDSALAAGATGYMTVSGYTLALTTAAVAIGDILVTTTAAAGYLATNNTPTAGTEVAKAVTKGTSAGGLTVVKLW